MSWLFTSGGRSAGVSSSASLLPMNTQGWFPLGLIAFLSLQSKGLSRIFSNTIGKHQFFSTQFYDPTLTLYMTTEKTIALTIQAFVGQIMSLPMSIAALFNISNIWKKMWCAHAHTHTHTHTHTYTHRNSTQPLKKKVCHLQWHGWTWRVSCWNRERQILYDIIYLWLLKNATNSESTKNKHPNI